MPRERHTRRSLLRAAGAFGAAGLAGCLGRSHPTDPTGSPRATPSTDSAARDETSRASSGTRVGTRPGVCPPAFYPEEAVQCSDRSGVRMTASKPELSMPRDEVTITLHNGSDTTLSGDVKHHRLYHRREGRWYLIRPRTLPASVDPMEIRPGSEYAWSILLDAEALAPENPTREGPPYRDFVFRLAPGPYWFGFALDGPDGRRAYAARFHVAGTGLPLEPSDRVVRSSTFRTDGTLSIRRRGHPDTRQVALDLERLPSIPAHATHLTTFELYNPGFFMRRHEDDVPIHTPNGTPVPGQDENPFLDRLQLQILRDALALYEGSVSRIRVETRAAVVPPLGLSESAVVVHRGTAWRVTSRNGWER